MFSVPDPIRRGLRTLFVPAVFCLAFGALPLAADSFAETDYVPPRSAWERVDPAAAGFDAERLDAAVAWIRAQAVTEPSDHQRMVWPDVLCAGVAARDGGARGSQWGRADD